MPNTDLIREAEKAILSISEKSFQSYYYNMIV
jgi:hypothetical protein